MRIEKSRPPSYLSAHFDESASRLQHQCFFLTPRWFALYWQEWAEKNYLGQATININDNDYFVLLSRGRQRSRLGLSYESVGFNEATEPLVQNLTVEFNGFLSAQDQQSFTDGQPVTTPTNFEGCFDEFLTGLVDTPGWDELRVSAISDDFANAAIGIARGRGLIATIFSERKTYSVDLDLIREKFNSEYLATRSSNTRAQLRKSRRSIEIALGPLVLEPANSLECAQLWLSELGTLHAKQWNESKAIQGFNNPRFVGFHRKALDQLWHEGKVQILRINAGNKNVAYLHYFVVEGRAYFNMSGINYEERDAVQPGLIAHWLAIDYFMSNGLSVYDFMGGTYRYKESLCTTKSGQKHLLFRRRRWFFVLEDFLRRLKRKRA